MKAIKATKVYDIEIKDCATNKKYVRSWRVNARLFQKFISNELTAESIKRFVESQSHLNPRVFTGVLIDLLVNRADEVRFVFRELKITWN